MNPELHRQKLLTYSVSKLKKIATEHFNAFIRERDKDEPCISCGKYQVSGWHAGHYLSGGHHSGIRFNEFNVNKQCEQCNTHLHGNQAHYREGLVGKYGELKVKEIEDKAAIFKRIGYQWNRLFLIEIILKYK